MASFAEDMKKRKQLKNKLSSGDYSHPSGADPTDTFTQSVAETMPPAIKESSTVKKVQSTPSKVSPKKSSSSSSKKKSSSSSSVKETTVVSDSGDDSIFGKTSLWDEDDEKSAFAKAANEALKRADTTAVYLDDPDHRNGEKVERPLWQSSRYEAGRKEREARRRGRDFTISGFFDISSDGKVSKLPGERRGRSDDEIIADADKEMRTGTGVEFYNDYQMRRSSNPLYNPFLAQQAGGTNLNPLSNADTSKMTASERASYMFNETPQLVEEGLTDEAQQAIKLGKSIASEIDSRITVDYVNPFGVERSLSTGNKKYNNAEGTDYMTEQELNQYYYLAGTYGTPIARRYFEELKPQLEERGLAQTEEMQAWRDRAREHPYLMAMVTAPMVLNPDDASYDVRDTISQGIAENESGLVRVTAGALQGLAENLAFMPLNALGGTGVALQAGLGAADQGLTARRQLEREGTLDQEGAALNIALQSIIGGMEWGGLSKAAAAPLNAVTSKMSKNALTSLVSNAAGSFLAGAGVGATQSTLMSLADTFTMGENSQYNRLKEQYIAQGMDEDSAARQAALDTVQNIATAALTGGVTGTAMALPGTLSEGITYRSRGKNIRENGSAAQTVDDGMTFAEDSDAYKNAVKLNSKLQRGLEVTDDEIGAQDILNRTEAARQAEYVARYQEATGQTVTPGETPEGTNAYNKNGRIVVAEDADEDIASLVRHEGAHGAENAESYSEYRSLVRQAENYDAIADRVRRTYDDLGMKYDDSVVESEVAADFARNFLKDTKDLSRLQRAAQNNTSLIDRAYNGIRTLEAKVKALGGREFQDPVTGLRVSYDDLNTMRRAFENALLEARETRYNDGSLMYSVKRNYDAAKYGVAIDSELTRLINELGINRRIFTAQDKSQIKEIIRSAYKAFDEGDTVTGARLLREAGDILRTKDPKKYNGEDIAKDFEDQFTELYYNGKSQNSAKQQRQQTQQDMKDYNVSVAGLVQRYERQNGIYLDKTERTAYSAAVRSAFNMLKNGDREGARAELRPVADSMVREARIENPGFTENERQLISRLDTLKLDYSELRNSPDENMRELYDRLRTITGSSTKGKRIDQVYGELESEFGKAHFDTSRETNPVDQLSRIAEVYDEIKNNETLPMYRDRDYDAAAEAMVDDMIHQYDRAQPADDSVTPPERIRSDMESYGIDIETPFRNMGMTGITEGNIEDLSNMVRRQLDAAMRAIDEDMGAGAGDTAARLYDDFDANFNERFGEIAGTMNVSDENKSAAAQLVYESVVTPMDAIVNSYLVTENDIISAAALGIEKADGTKVTPAELEFAKKRADRLTKTQQKIRGMKLSNYYTNSGQKPFFTPETRKVMDERKDEFYYEGITNKGTYERAKKNIAREGIDKTMSALMSKKKWTAFDNAEALALIAHFQENGDHQRAVDIFSVQRRHLTEAGQFVQSAKLISKLSPDGRFIDSMRQMDNYVDEQIERSGNPAQIRQKLKRAEETDRQRDAGKRDQYNSMLRDQTKAMQDLHDIDRQVEETGKVRDETEEKLNDLNKRLDAQLEKNNGIKRQRQEAEAELEKTRGELNDAREEETRLSQQVGAAKKNMNAVRGELGEKLRELSELKETAEKFENTAEREAEMSREAETADVKSARTRRTLSEKRNRLKALEDETKDIDNAIGREARIAEDEGDIDSQESEANNALDEKRSELAELRKQRTSAKGKIKRAADIDKRIKDVQKEIAGLQKKLEVIQQKRQEFSELRKQRTSDKNKIKRYEKRKPEIEKQKAELRKEIEALEKQLETETEQYNRLRDELSGLRKRRSKAKSGIKYYTGRREKVTEQTSTVEAEVRELETKLESVRKEYEEVNEGYKNIRDMRNRLKKEVKRLEERAEKLTERADDISGEISKLRRERDAAQKEYDAVLEKYTKLIDSRNDTRRTLMTIVRNKNRIVDEYTKAGKKLNSAVDEVLNSEGIKHIPEHIRSYISAAFNWIEYIDNIDDFIDLIIIPTSKMRKTSAGNSIKKSLKKAAKDGGVEMMKGIAINQLYGLVQDYMPKSKFAKMNTVHTSAMLINSTTFIRNILSNAFFSPFETATNYVAIIPDMVMSLWTKNRSVAMENPFIGWTNAAKRARLSRIEQALNVEGLTDDANPYISKRRTMTSRAGTWMERWLGYSLSVPDEWQKGYVEEQVRRSLERARSLRKHETMVYDDGSFINDPKYIRRLLESTTELKPREIDEVIINLRGYVPTPERIRDAIAEADTTLRRAEAEFIENIRTMDKAQLISYIDSLTPSDVIYEGAMAVKDAISKRASDEDIASAFNRAAPEGDSRDYIAMRAMFMENLATMSRKNFKNWLDSQPKNSPFADAFRAAKDTMETGIARQDMEAVFREGSTRNRSTANEFYDTINSLSDAEITMMMDPRPAFTDQDIADIVNQEILYRTFQDDSVIARVFTGIKRTGNEIGTKEFGLGDFVMKFTKVPGNIMTRKLEYSPWGYFKFFYTVAKVMYDNKKAHRPMSPAQQRSIALTLARPTTSLGCMAAGAWLRHVGIIVGTSTEYDQEYEEKQWNKAKNLGDFMINLSALKRFLDGESTDAQDGDDLLDIGWLEPVNSGFTFGASLYDQVGAGFIEAMGADGNEGEWEESAKEGKSKANEAFEYGKEHFREIITGMINPVIGLFEDISAVRGIKQLFYNWEDAGGQPDIFAAITLSDWAQGFFPAMGKRVGNVEDLVTRNPYKEEDWWAALKASWKSSLPFMSLREQVPESVDVFGDTKSSTLGNVWMDILNEFIMPGRISKYKKTEITDEIDRLSQYSTDVIPKTPFQKNNRVTIDGHPYSFELSGKSYEEYSKLYGQMQYDWIKDIIGNEYYKYMSDNEKVELLSQAVKDAQTTMKEYWVYKKHGASQETLDSVVADAKSELVSEPAMTMKKKQAIRWIQQDGVKVEDYTDAYLQVPVNQIPEEMEKQINNAEKAIARTKAGKQYKEVNGKRVYSRDWTQQERDDKIAQEQAEIENIKNGTKKKNVDITGEWKDLTPEQQEKLEWYIDKYVDEIELPEEAISVMIDDSTKPYEEAEEITDLDEEELGTLAYEPEDDDNTYTLAQAGGRYESSGSSSSSSGSSGRRSSGGGSRRSRRSSGRSYSRSGRSSGRSYGGSGSGRSSGGYSRSGGWSGFGGSGYSGGGGSGGGTMLASALRIPGEKRSAGDINPIIDRLFANMRPRLNDPRIPYDELITQPYDPRPSLTPYFYA